MDKLKFPDGYDITVCRKKDILNCIDDNIIDKEVAFELITQLEKDAAELIKKGKWVGIPYIGNIRENQVMKLEHSEEQQELIKEAKEELTQEDYLLFRRSLRSSNYARVKHERYFNYITSMMANKNKQIYKDLCKHKGETYAKIFLFSLYNAKVICTPSYEIEYEQQLAN